jgi:hypothetical protein
VEAGTIVGALASILTGTVLTLGTMIVVGDIYANSPIFPGLIGSLVAYLAGSLLSKPTPSRSGPNGIVESPPSGTTSHRVAEETTTPAA